MKNKEALDYITEQGKDSRTIMFNAFMFALTSLLTSVAFVIGNDYPLFVNLLPLGLNFISSIGSIWLYGLTQKKRARGGYNHLDKGKNNV